MNPDPEDVVKYFYESTEEFGHMIDCSCLSYSSRVNIAPTVVDKYSFLCHFFTNSNVVSIFSLHSEISLLRACVIKIETVSHFLTSSSMGLNLVSKFLDCLSTKVQSTFHSFPASIPSSFITSNTINNPISSITQPITLSLLHPSSQIQTLLSFSTTQPISCNHFLASQKKYHVKSSITNASHPSSLCQILNQNK